MLAFLPASAWERSEADMQRIAGEKLKSISVDGRLSSGVKKLLDKKMVSVYGTGNDGFVVVSRSSSTSPVIGYSDSRFNPETMPDGLSWWISEADRVITDREKISTCNAPEKEVAPLLKTAWSQDSPFNNLCPETGGFWGAKTQTGCVATAMAQVLNFFRYPAQSTGTGSYSTDGQTFKDVKMSTVFNWDKMKDRYNLGYAEDEAKAVAELMRECGYASKMVYTSQGSGANLYDAAYGLAHNMQYDSLSMKVMTRSYYHDEEWIKAIYNELTSGRPVLYAATDMEKLAHCFVFDGLDKNGFVHVNWGWSGTANGYFDITSISGLNPSYMDPYTASQIKYNFSQEHLMVVGLNPSAVAAEGAEYESFFGTYEIPDLMFQDDSLLISSIPLFNFSHLDFKGLLGLVIEGEDGHAVVQPFFYSGWEEGRTIPVISGVMFTEEYYPSATLNDTDGKTPRPDGKYKFYFVSWSEQEMEAKLNPRMIRYPAYLAAEGEEPVAIWEAEKKNGHWVAESLHRIGESTGVGNVFSESPVTEHGSDGVFTLDGKKIGSDSSIVESLSKVTPVIVRNGSSVYKILTH